MLGSKPPTPARLEQWARLRASGKRHYVRYHGLLKIGTSLFVILGGWLFLIETGLILLIMGGTELPVPLPVPGKFWLLLFAIAVLCYTLGYMVGKSRWNHNEEWYDYYTNQRQPVVRHDAE